MKRHAGSQFHDEAYCQDDGGDDPSLLRSISGIWNSPLGMRGRRTSLETGVENLKD
jgi:hypothetical protein